jgi:DNA polymerase-4
LLGITALDVLDKKESIKQLDLFSYEEDAKDEALLNAIEQLKRKFGEGIIQPVSELLNKENNHS